MTTQSLIHGVIERCFDPSFPPGKQPQDSWDLFWRDINLVFPIRNDPDRKKAMGAHVLRYIEDIRGHRKSPKTAKWGNTVKNHIRRGDTASCQPAITPMTLPGSPLILTPRAPDPMARSCTASKVTLGSMSIVSEEDLVPEYLPPRRCLVPPQPREHRTYEISIVATSSVRPQCKFPTPELPPPSRAVKPELSMPSAPLEHVSISPSTTYGKIESVPCVSTEGPPTTDTGEVWHETELQAPLGYSPDVYNFLRSCVPETTHLIKLFVDELGITDLKSLFAIMRWPPSSRDRYFFNLTRNGKLNYIDSDAIKRRLCDMQTELETAAPNTW
ncbi:hypothetical protein PLEOSDRAFT_152525 [Pleurotus ostreatus PC15]|uniref:Uncharacterized protein n=1 Tax=Pleurotus ostreatus (strain PC15) TaxID=1137138 RepID=A0A067P3N7_PLEO1|nr:hypothetical protein PLEOSDRAFT_152525 [Pleurotus ostreatus PC15]